MKNKKKTYTLVAILVAILALGIGYAAVSTLMSIEGTANALVSDGVKLEFTGTPTNNGTQAGNSASIDGTDPTKGICTVVLKNMNESATCTFTITNNTTDTTISAKDMAASVYSDSGLTTAWTSSSSQYFTINTPTLSATTLAHGASATVSVTVSLKKENTTGSPIVQNFYVKVVGDTDQS